MEDKSIKMELSAEHVLIKQRHPLSGRYVALNFTHEEMKALIEEYENSKETS